MPTIEKGRPYKIALRANRNVVWDVYENRLESSWPIAIHRRHNGLNQEFYFFALDGGKYAIVARSSGLSVDAYSSLGVVYQNRSNGGNRQQWYLQDAPDSSVEIVSQDWGQVASFGSYGGTGDLVDLDYINPSDPDRTWYLEPINYQAPLPQLVPTKPLGGPPQYSAGPYEVLPDQTEAVTVSNAILPCILVNDGSVPPNVKIQQSPYYLMTKQQFWQKIAFGTVAPNSKRIFSYKTGATAIDQKSMSDTLSITVGGDFGLQFKGASASAKFEISRQIQTVISSTNESMTEYGDSIEYDNSAGTTLKGVSLYQLVTRYAAYRTNGTSVSDPWTFLDNKSTVMVVS
ncbi:hypothetical protein CUC43_32395 (plasmid) [Bacillus thuringiensis LM1212]|uniref:RICIN domain-containing protein n=1 Tax=Bacillus thuringiensis TaxID=1428 RepID=UPI0003FBEFBC|nr:RICIN domain-containing protein [Bacillus thuringiensis]AXY11317.1 hypothetical protein CUC43_32395 [Bacillus thuringiensis LM1212]